MTTEVGAGAKRHSRGPRTPEGKSVSSKNARKHGLLSRELVLADEDRRELDLFAQAMLRALAPVGALERSLADRAIGASWRLRRVERIETMALEGSRQGWRGDEVPLSSGFVGLCVNGDVFSKLSRYEAALERSLYRALHELQRLQAARAGFPVSPPVAVDVQVTRAPATLPPTSFGSSEGGSTQRPPA